MFLDYLVIIFTKNRIDGKLELCPTKRSRGIVIFFYFLLFIGTQKALPIPYFMGTERAFFTFFYSLFFTLFMTLNQKVTGSNPPWLTIYRRNDGGLRQVP